MPITSPQLDDLVFDRTVQELVRRIPVYAPEWTNYNQSDPGITLIQLFAYLAEQIAYRLNQIPEKNYIELLKLLGITLEPALPSTSQIALLLSDPSTLTAYTLSAGAKVNASAGSPPPTFETQADVDVTPAEVNLMMTTANPLVYDLLYLSPGQYAQLPSTPPQVPSTDNSLMNVVWDGKTPKLATMPQNPVSLLEPTQGYFWIGVDLNALLAAGFRGVSVTMTVQFDDDEQPSLTADQTCAPGSIDVESPPVIDWLYYFDATAGAMQQVTGRITDTTAQFTQSGAITFTVPLTIGPITTWQPLQAPVNPTPLQACVAFAQSMQTGMAGLVGQNNPPVSPPPPAPQPALNFTASQYGTVITSALQSLQQNATATPPIGNPLAPSLQSAPDAWFRITLAALPASGQRPKIRIVTFNAVAVKQVQTAGNELLGKGNGRPGQSFTLANDDVVDGSLSVAMQEDVDPTTPLVSWTEVPTLDTAGPLDSVYTLDAEAGVITFGDGTNGRIPPLVPGTGDIVALTYEYGGGSAGNIGVGTITTVASSAPGVSQVVNFVAATGGRDAETLDQAKIRARKLLSSRDRAVTVDDFVWIASQTPAVNVGRVTVIPLQRPLSASGTAPTPPTALCSPLANHPALPATPAGLDPTTAPGAVTVVVVPQEVDPEPIPTPSFLRAVCVQLDAHRLVTTEVHVAPPQYCRICSVLVTVVPAAGYTRAQIQQAVEDRLGTYLHVLTGGDDGTGFPFGGQVHIADIMSQVFRVAGVTRVESITAQFTRTKTNATPRQGTLTLCPTGTTQFDKINLGLEENVSIDVTSIAVTTASS